MKLSLSSILAIVAVLAAFTFVNVCTTFAQGTAAPGEYKIGIVDLQRALDGYKRNEAEVAKLQKEFESTQGELDKLKAALEAKGKAFEAEKDKLSEDDRAQRASELEQEAIAYDGELRQATAELNEKKASLKQSLLKDLVAVIQQIGTEEKYHLILEADPETRTGVMYHATSMDITSKVIERLNKK